MILDRIENRQRYAGLPLGIPRALDYLAATDFARLSDGRHEIDGDRLFALVQHYQTRPAAQARWEIHERYLDVQYIVAGSERIGFAPWREGLPVEQAYDPARDLAFYIASGALLTLNAGSFAIFAPRELHAPSLAPADDGTTPAVFKVVIKCRWEP